MSDGGPAGTATSGAPSAASTSSGATSAGELQPPKQAAEAPPEEASAAAFITLVVAVACALTFSFLCSIFESVLLSVSRGHVEKMANSGSAAGRTLRRWKKTDIEAPIAVDVHHGAGTVFALGVEGIHSEDPG